jgi:hypothetical protein
MNSIAIHEAAHAVFATFLQIAPKKVYLYENQYNIKLGEMFPITDRKYDILHVSQNDYNDPEIKPKINKAALAMLFTLIAGNCAEKYSLDDYPNFPPYLQKESDGYYCQLIIERFCVLNSITFNSTKFNQVYFELMDIVYNKLKEDRHLYEIILMIAKKLEKKKSLGFFQIVYSITGVRTFKIIFKKYKPYPFLEYELGNIIK